MKWFDNWFQRKCIEALNPSHEEDEGIKLQYDPRDVAFKTKIFKASSNSNSNGGLTLNSISGIGTVSSARKADFHADPINLKIYKADGGFIVETSHYDRHTDNHESKLHIINSDQDLGERLGHIITLHALRT